MRIPFVRGPLAGRELEVGDPPPHHWKVPVDRRPSLEDFENVADYASPVQTRKELLYELKVRPDGRYVYVLEPPQKRL